MQSQGRNIKIGLFFITVEKTLTIRTSSLPDLIRRACCDQKTMATRRETQRIVILFASFATARVTNQVRQIASLQ